MNYNPKSLQDISYDAHVNKYGIPPHEITVGKKYKIIEKDGVNYTPLGKCLENSFEISGHPLDPIFVRTLKFEENHDNPILKKQYYGNSSYEKTNIVHF
jgi:hypothetical protein